MSAKVYKNGAWVDITTPKINSGGGWKDTESMKRYSNGAWVTVWENYQFEFRKGDRYLGYSESILASGGSVMGSGRVRPSTSGGNFAADFYVAFNPPVRLTAQNAVQCDIRLDGTDLTKFYLKARYSGNPDWTNFALVPSIPDSGSYTGKAGWRTAMSVDIRRLEFRIFIDKFPVSTAYGGPIQFTISNMTVNGGCCKFEEFSEKW